MDNTDKKIREIHIKVYKYIKNYLQQNNLSPSYREIAEGCEISLSNCHRLVNELQESGYVEAKSKKCRSIRI